MTETQVQQQAKYSDSDTGHYNTRLMENFEPGTLMHSSHTEPDHTLVVELRGDVDLATVGRLREMLDGAVASAESPNKLRLDMSRVDFIDSAGLAFLVDIRGRFENTAPLSLVVRKGSQPERVLKLGQFDLFIPIHFASESEAPTMN